MIVKYKAYSFLVSKYIKRRRETWEKIFIAQSAERFKSM